MFKILLLLFDCVPLNRIFSDFYTYVNLVELQIWHEGIEEEEGSEADGTTPWDGHLTMSYKHTT